MKILMLSDHMDAGGAETHIASLCRALTSKGDAVTLLSAGGRIAEALRGEGVRTVTLPAFTHAPFRLLRLYTCLLCHLVLHRYDVLHVHARLPALLCRYLPRPLRPFTVVTVHARFPWEGYPHRLSWWGDETVAVSEDLRVHTARAFRVPYGRIRVIPNGIDTAHFSPEGRGEHTGTRILFASRMDADCVLGARMLLSLMPRLLRRFPSVTLTLAGGGNAYEEIAALADACNRAVGRQVVTLTGHVGEMPALYRAHGIFVGVSRAAMEAAACGCAVILCGDEGMLGILSEDRFPRAAETNLTCRDCAPPTLSRMERELCRLLSDGALRERIAQGGGDWVREHFPLLRMSDTVRALYREILPHGNGKRILIGGYYGKGNVGDDTILAGTRESLRALDPTVSLTALTGRGRQDAKRFGIPCICRHSPVGILRAMKRADLFLCGGGSLLQNKTSNRSLLYYLTLLRLSRALGTPPVLWAAGIGPLHGERAEARVRETLSLCARLSLRDPDSRLLLERIGVDAPLVLGADPALLYPLPSQSFSDAVLKDLGLTRGGYYCIVPKGDAAWDPPPVPHLSPVVLVLDRPHDAAAGVRLSRALSAPLLFPDPDTLLALLSGAALTLTARLHAMILSTVAGSPSIGLPTDPADKKLSAFAELAGHGICSPADTRALRAAVRKVLSERDAHVARLHARAEVLRKKAQKDLANAVEMLYNIDSTKERTHL